MAEAEERSRAIRSAIRPDLGNTYRYMGLLLSFLVSDETTGGRLSMIHVTALRGTEPAPHIHANEDEIYLIREGTVEFFVEGLADSIVANEGDTVFLPCGKAHALRYHSDRIQMLMTLDAVPARKVGTERFFRAMALGPADSMEMSGTMTRYADLGEAGLAEVNALAADAGLEFLPPDKAQLLLPNFPGP